jgi:hypothetical protein
VRGGYVPQCQQHRFDPKAGAETEQGRPGGCEKLRHQPSEQMQGKVDWLDTVAQPAQYPRQLDVQAQPLSGRLPARRLLGQPHHRLDLGQGA